MADDEKVELPSEEDLAKLPRFAIVAWAARCARRVEPVVSWSWPERPMGVPETVDRAITLSERSPQSPRIPKAAGLVVDLFHKASGFVDASPLAIGACWSLRSVALASLSASISARSTTPDEANRALSRLNMAPADASRHDVAPFALRSGASADKAVVEAAAIAFPSDDREGALRRTRIRSAALAAMRRDFDLLRESARIENWGDKMPVSPAFFGPLWPWGEPDGWRGEGEASSEDEEITLTIRIPAGVGEDEAIERINEIFKAADELHVAHGGHGLTVSSVEVSQPDHSKVPGGGS